MENIATAYLDAAQHRESRTTDIDGIVNIVQNITLETEDQRFELKRKLVQAIDSPYREKLQFGNNFEAFHSNLKKILGIEDEKFLVYRLLFLVYEKLDKIEYARSPRDFDKFFHEEIGPKTVKKLIENQYKIEWNTKTGDPDQFSVYRFCDDSNKKFLTYDTRKAHVITRLWCAQNELRKIRKMAYKELCPPVYVVTDINGQQKWRKWNLDASEFMEEEEASIDWITNVDLRNYISHNGGKRVCKGKRHLYWAVLEEDDYTLDQTKTGAITQVYVGEERKDTITQVYVGKADNGIKERWTGSHRNQHCKKMGLTRDVLCEMLSYDPTAIQSIMLVDLRLLLHKAFARNGDKSGLFIMEEYDVEQKTGAKRAKGETVAKETEMRTSSKAETKSKERMKREEENNINGLTVDGKNPIIETNKNWKPRDMKYGMNG